MTPLLLAAALTATAPGPVAEIDAPAPRVGDVREYQTTDDWTSQVRMEDRQEVIGVLPGFTRVRNEQKAVNLRTRLLEPRPPEEETVRSDLNVDYVSKDGTSRRLNFAWPLHVGKKWDYEYSFPVPDASGRTSQFTFRLKAEVTGWENVDTPAGTFRAVKVVHKGGAENAAFPGVVSPVGWTLWYAPDVSGLVKATYQFDSASGTPGMRTTMFLTSFRRAGN